MAYDIIGDIHGQSDKLHALLAHLGYQDKNGAYRHSDRTAIFVGDFIDKGPKQLDTVMTVRRMVDAGTAQAVMGNHEFNAIAWHTPDPDFPAKFLRSHDGALGNSNRRQHAAFLNEVQSDAALHREVVDWFKTLPLWLELPEVRVVHACWHDGYMKQLMPYLTPQNQLTSALLVSASRSGRMEFNAVECLTKGPEARLPDGRTFIDKYGHHRPNVRIQWWNADGSTYRELAHLPEELRAQLPVIPLEQDSRSRYESAKPVFFGHYWMTGILQTQSSAIACVDYSAGEDGPLVAYRWDGELALTNKNFHQVG